MTIAIEQAAINLAVAAAQVVSGIGFLGAGLIFREGLSVRGLNTAATLWCSAAIGVLAGAGYLAYAALATGFVVFVNLLLRPIVSFINRQPLSAILNRCCVPALVLESMLLNLAVKIVLQHNPPPESGHRSALPHCPLCANHGQCVFN